MKTKTTDKLYCGVDETKIKNANPSFNEDILELFYNFLVERYNIHLKKDVYKQDPPWTEDEILQKYRFTNIRREHDKNTVWLINNISNNESISYEDKLLNTIIYRAYNLYSTAEILGMPFKFDEVDFKEKKKIARNSNNGLYSTAFFMSGLKGAIRKSYCKEDTSTNELPIVLVENLYKDNFVNKIIKCSNQKECFERIREIDGFADFLAYQVFVDFTYIEEFPFSENEFVVNGPGARLGLSFLFKDKDGMNDEECIFWMRDNLENLFVKMGKEAPSNGYIDLEPFDRKMNVMSLENCMCELSKYVKIYRGDNSRRRTYHQKC